MRRLYRVALGLVLVLCPACVSEAAKNQAAVTAAAQTGYDRMIRTTLGEVPPQPGEAVAFVTTADLAATPAPVRGLLEHLTRSFYKNSNAWLVLDHALNDSPEVAPLVPPAALVPPGGP